MLLLARNRQLFYGWPRKQDGQRNLLSKNLLYSSTEPRSKKRMPSQIEKVVPNPNRPCVQQFFPDLNQLIMRWQRWSYRGLFLRTFGRLRDWQNPPIYLAIWGYAQGIK